MKNLFSTMIFLGVALTSFGQSTTGYKSVISEDFTNNKLGWSQNTSNVNKAWIEYSKKVMILDVKDGDDRRSIGYSKFDFNEDFILKAVVGIKEDEIKSNDNSRIGIVFGYTSHDYTGEQGWYAVFLDVLEDNVTIRATNGNGSQLYENEVKTSYDIAGKTTIGVKKDGDKLSVFINDKSIFENVATETSGGAITLIAKNKVRGLFYGVNLYEKDVPPTPEEVAVKQAVSADEEKVMVEAISNLEFDTGKSTLRSTSHAALNKMAEMMTRNTKFRVILTGHTDNVGDPKSNLKLSQDRVNSVVDFLASKGIDKGRFAALGYGDQRPVADNDTPEGRQKNRRVEFEIVL